MYTFDLYCRIRADPGIDVVPRVFVFGAKAAPGYKRAKAIIKFINEVGRVVNNDPDTKDLIRVVLVENYNVTPAEYIIPTADVSEQISMAGKEASGTSNMKFMMSGALTLDTLDGANMKTVEVVGEDNAYIFGAREEELPELRHNYDPRHCYETVPGLRHVMDAFVDGTLNDGGSGDFHDLRVSLIDGSSWDKPDTYHLLDGFASCREARDHMAEDYHGREEWVCKCWVNIYRSGIFGSDRTIGDYACEVWEIEPKSI